MSDIWPISFEGKKYAFRQARDGIILSFVVHPSSDCIAVLAAAEIGFDFQVTLRPMEPGSAIEAPMQGAPSMGAGNPNDRWAQAARRKLSEGERAVQKAGIMASDKDFQKWVLTRRGSPTIGFTDMADFIRKWCVVESRRELATDHNARQRFYMMVDTYEKEMGLRAEER